MHDNQSLVNGAEAEVLLKRQLGEDFTLWDLAVVNEAISRSLGNTPDLIMWSEVHRQVAANIHNTYLQLPIMEVS